MSSAVEVVTRMIERLTGRKRLTLVGHSHLWAFTEVARETRHNIHIVDFWKFADPFKQNELSVIDTALPAPVYGPVVSLIGGTRYNILTLYESSRPFDFVLPDSALPLRDDCEILPFEAVRTSLLALMEPNLRVLKAVRKRTTGRVYQLDAPPPWGEDRNPSDYPKDPWLQTSDRFGDRWLRLKMATLETRLMKEFCDANDIVLIAPPADAKDAEGFLRTGYFADLMHANTGYGRLALAHVLAVIKK